MDVNGSNSNSHESQPPGTSNAAGKEKLVEKEDDFVNHVDTAIVDNMDDYSAAEIAWNEMRKQWVGDPSHNTQRVSREPIMSWTTTYEDLLLTTEPFQQPIPLAEMVDFLVDIWLEEGLYD